LKNRIIICDLDGTIIDSRLDLTNTVNSVRAHYSLPPLDLETVTSYVGDGAKALISRALRDSDADVDEALELMQKFYAENIPDKKAIYPTVINGLKSLKSQGYKLAVATNKPHAATIQLMDMLELSQYFDVILGARSDYSLKPDPAMLNIAIEQTNSAPEGSWMIGDNHTDLLSGHRAGLQTCFAEYGFGCHADEHFDMTTTSFANFANSKLS
jgi:phosphoglycolate phosphatase